MGLPPSREQLLHGLVQRARLHTELHHAGPDRVGPPVGVDFMVASPGVVVSVVADPAPYLPDLVDRFQAWSALVGLSGVSLYADTYYLPGEDIDGASLVDGRGSVRDAFEVGHPDATRAVVCGLATVGGPGRGDVTILPYVDRGRGEIEWGTEVSDPAVTGGVLTETMRRVIEARPSDPAFDPGLVAVSERLDQFPADRALVAGEVFRLTCDQVHIDTGVAGLMVMTDPLVSGDRIAEQWAQQFQLSVSGLIPSHGLWRSGPGGPDLSR